MTVVALKTLERGAPFRWDGARYTVEMEADRSGLVLAVDGYGIHLALPAETRVEKSA